MPTEPKKDYRLSIPEVLVLCCVLAVLGSVTLGSLREAREEEIIRQNGGKCTLEIIKRDEAMKKLTKEEQRLLGLIK